MTDRYDVIIVSSGAGGGTLAHTLAPTGKKILLLERGNFPSREMANWDPGAVFVDGRCRFGTDPSARSTRRSP
jgi:choline dehydrogenase-like flavoprotein